VAVLLSTMALFLLVVRATHAGALWRDECAVVNLARMPSVADIVRNFQHEAFPVPFPILIRAYTNVFGDGDIALRCFGIAAGIALLGALWFSAYATGRGPPLISLALLGLNTTFLFWGTTVRGYGLASALIILAFSSIASVMINASPARIILAAVVSVAAVQCLVHNLALIFALAASAAIVCLVRHDPRRLIIFLSILGLCMLLLATSAWKLYRLRFSRPVPEWNLLLFASLAAIAAPIAYYEFLQTLSYLTRSWYFLALVSMLAVALDCLAQFLSSAISIRFGRLIFAATAFIILPINGWPKIIERQTNIDIVADKVTKLAKPADLIVVAPWQYGISFQRYYHSNTPWITLPAVPDLRVHRYDLFREKMLSPRPIDDVLERVRQTLAAGNRVWVVGGIKLPPEGRAPSSLPLPPNSSAGWDNVAYSDSWMQQLSAFVRAHSEHGQTVPLGSIGLINNFEDVPLVVVNGWQ